MTKLHRGFDISHYQPNVDYKLMARRGQFCIVKGCNGTATNSKFHQHWYGLQDAGMLLRGAYCYFLPSVDPVEQAEKLYSLAEDGEIEFGHLDLEWNSVDGTHNHPSKFPDYGERVLACLYRMAELWNNMPAIYSNYSHIQSYLNSPVFAEFRLWIASWGTVAPNTPKPFFPMDWYMWQTGITQFGEYYGLIGSDSLDVDLMNPDWLVKIIPPAPPEPPEPGTGKWVVLENGLRVRSDHSTSGTSTYGYINRGDQVDELDVWSSGNDIWVQHNKIGKVGWSAANYGGKEYMRRV